MPCVRLPSPLHLRLRLWTARPGVFGCHSTCVCCRVSRTKVILAERPLRLLLLALVMLRGRRPSAPVVLVALPMQAWGLVAVRRPRAAPTLC